MERDRDALLQGHARRALPRMLHVREVRMDGTLEVGGTFGGGDVVCQTEARCLPRFESAQHLKLRFRALLTEGDTSQLELRIS